MNTISTEQIGNAYEFSAAASTLTQGGGAAFLAAMARLSQQNSVREPDHQGISTTAGKTADTSDLEASAAARAAAVHASGEADGASETRAVSLEEMLQARYPGIHYHVFDASSSNWKFRNDYPHHLLYTDGDKAKETLENWKPEGENPFYGSKNGQFIAPKEIHALGSVPPGSKAVVIHPKVQERMESDPAYATEIFERIQAWFALDVARNDAIRAAHGDGSCEGIMSQAVAIGEDGNICNAQASSGGGTITVSSSGSDPTRGSGRAKSGWEARLERHDEIMARIVEAQIRHKIETSEHTNDLLASKAALAKMLDNSNLAKVLGTHVSGMPISDFLSLVGTQLAAL